MPLFPGLVSGKIISAFPSKHPLQVPIAMGIEYGLYTWLASCSVSIPVVSGPVGNGSALGKLTVTPDIVLMEASLKGAGVLGSLSSVVSTASSIGISLPYDISGASIGVNASGFVGGIFKGSASLLAGSLEVGFKSNGVLGSLSVLLSNGLSQGILFHFLSGKIVGTVTPVTVPGPSVSSIPLELILV